MKKVGRPFTKILDINEHSESCGVIFMDMNEMYKYKTDNGKKEVLEKATKASALVQARSDKDEVTIKGIKTIKVIQQYSLDKKMELIEDVLQMDCNKDCSLMNLVFRYVFES